ncbi:MAG: hypothetical protein MUC43_00265 [Pirellula sp.]|jgi:hypothetical protein|nr:hypothetical protein [Pirellula sp.]
MNKWIVEIGIILIPFILLFAFLWLDAKRVPCPKKWPPISEDEFLRRCSPGVDRERALKVRRIIAEQLGVDYDRIYPEQRFVEDLHAD